MTDIEKMLYECNREGFVHTYCSCNNLWTFMNPRFLLCSTKFHCNGLASTYYFNSNQKKDVDGDVDMGLSY